MREEMESAMQTSTRRQRASRARFTTSASSVVCRRATAGSLSVRRRSRRSGPLRHILFVSVDEFVPDDNEGRHRTNTNTGLCKLVSASVVATALGTRMTSPKTIVHGSTTQCGYSSKERTGTAVLMQYDTNSSASTFANSRTVFEHKGLNSGADFGPRRPGVLLQRSGRRGHGDDRRSAQRSTPAFDHGKPEQSIKSVPSHATRWVSTSTFRHRRCDLQ